MHSYLSLTIVLQKRNLLTTVHYFCLLSAFFYLVPLSPCSCLSSSFVTTPRAVVISFFRVPNDFFSCLSPLCEGCGKERRQAYAPGGTNATCSSFLLVPRLRRRKNKTPKKNKMMKKKNREGGGEKKTIRHFY